MTDESRDEKHESEQETTLPVGINVKLDGPFESEEEARNFGYRLLSVMQIMGRTMDLSGVDGVTVSASYHQALAELDRGKEGLRTLTATDEEGGAIGVAMAPAVLRDGQVKTHLVFNVHVILGLQDPEGDMFQLCVHTVAHECAHAMTHTAFDRCFPNVILQEGMANYVDRYRDEVTSACWEEYAATRISADWGADPMDGYIETFTRALAEANDAADNYIRAYRTHADLDQVLAEVPPIYANLIKWASYLIGTMHGLEKAVADIPVLAEALKTHWFAQYFEKLEEAYSTIWSRFGEWTERSEFDPVGNIAVEVLEEGGIFLTKTDDDGAKVDIPFRPNNTPLYGLLNAFGRH